MKQETYDWRKHTVPENISTKSITVPDHSYSIRDILEKFTTGQPLSGIMSYNEFDGEFDNNPRDSDPDFEGFLPNPNTLDLVDRQRLAKTYKEQIAGIDERNEARKKLAEDTKKQSEITVKELQDKISRLEASTKPANEKPE